MSDRIDAMEGAAMPSTVENTPATALGRRMTWLRAIGITVFIFCIPALFRERDLVQLPFNDKPVKLLQRLRPDGVLLGDSMLASRINPEALRKVSNVPCALLPYPGSGTALWFLVTKNIVAAQSHPPHWMIIFFRDKQLTMPAHRTGERYRDGLEMCMQGDEPLFHSILAITQRDTEPWTEHLVDGFYILQRKRKDWQTKVQYGALKAVAGRPERAPVREAAARIFKPTYSQTEKEAISARDGEVSLDIESHDFQANVAQSFLPAILEVAQRSHIQLLFYRVKRRPKDSHTPSVDKPNLQKYAQALREYLSARGALLVDETTDPEVTFAYYSSDDHVQDSMMAPYTKLFWNKVRPVLDNAGAASLRP
ncbi:hypothetical protein CfE428DRAFT_4451 [Chthoniobacter flavus Ellin428]|uniref:Uncharacterized protein n=1 Tax=Chthoniobacter flavus Ellin428 TaxID=497964 RepID=B4D6B2_9BACT|nr:hypothetical protein [Chthoniobacter flavus]EDY18021.1 hypothetical protein CfE428DRAFT_4451 [Chthoniobacter flavus Ellin428]TCO88263.1 hypothetical protein EV701_11859 [Chthoniobacter flavus]